MTAWQRSALWAGCLLTVVVGAISVWLFVVLPSKQTATFDRDTDILVEAVERGGLCPDGRECQSHLVVYNTGIWEIGGSQGTHHGKLPDNDLSELKSTLANTPVNTWATASEPELCARDTDGSSIIYGFHAPEGQVTWIDTCEHQIPSNDPLTFYVQSIFSME